MKVFFILTVLALTAVEVVAIRKDGDAAIVNVLGNFQANHSDHVLGLQRMKDGADLFLAETDAEGDVTFEGTSGRIVALFFDYDGCCDFLNPLLKDSNSVSPGYFENHGVTDKYLHERAKLIDWLKAITAGADRVILFVGSNRQSISIDRIIEGNPGGFASIENGGFEAIRDVIGAEVSHRGSNRRESLVMGRSPPWEMNYALVADLNGARPDMRTSAPSRFGSSPESSWAWKNARLKCTEEFMNRRISRAAQKRAEDDLKWMMVMNNMNQLKGMNVDVYYIDDKQVFLTHTGKEFKKEHDSGFRNWGDGYQGITFHTVKWDYMDWIMDNQDNPIQIVAHN